MFKKSERDLIESKAVNFHRMRIFASRFHKDHVNLIITGGWDDNVRVIFINALNIKYLL